MLEDLLKNAKDDEELIAFLLEYANFFDENDLKQVQKVEVKENIENVSESNNIVNIEVSNTKEQEIEEVVNKNDNIASIEEIEEENVTIESESTENNTSDVNIDSGIETYNDSNIVNIQENNSLVDENVNNAISKKVIRLKSKPNTIVNRRNKVLVHKIVKEGIENHINPICVKVYKKLLDRNIFIKNILVTDTKIKIVLDRLSAENEAVFAEGVKMHPHKYKIVGNNNIVEIQRENKSESILKNELVKSMRFLKMQDVQMGYIDQKRFLMNFCDCEKVEGHTDIEYNKNIKIIFDESKMEKSFEEYLLDKKFDKLYSADNNKVYLDEYYLKAHLRYIDYIKNIGETLKNINNFNNSDNYVNDNNCIDNV